MAKDTHATSDLPTVAEVEASTEILSIRTNTINVVRVKVGFAVKIAHSIPPLEAENIKFIAVNSKVHVPKVHANFVVSETDQRYTIIDFGPRSDLHRLLPSLTATETKTVGARIKEALDGRRGIPLPGSLGNLNGTSYFEGVLGTRDDNPIISGPFENQEQMDHGIRNTGETGPTSSTTLRSFIARNG
ncbi:hypothetical protein BBP40_007884 [Aspergillus hancockii]|nr:hypothetical protein BBP40_007884 [Aspergillus hancockii]